MGMEILELKVDGMSCQHCVMSIKREVGAVKGVDKVEVDLKAKRVIVDYDAEQVEPEVIKTTIEDQGYDIKK